MNTEDGQRFLALVSSIDADRTIWILRALVLAQRLEAYGVDAEAIFHANKETLFEMLEKPQMVEWNLPAQGKTAE